MSLSSATSLNDSPFNKPSTTLYRILNAPTGAKLCTAALSLIALTACDRFTAAPVEFSQDDIETVGEVNTLEIHGRVLSSLPSHSNTVDASQAELGRLLFWDPILSGDRDVACATCHVPELAYTDGQSTYHQAVLIPNY